MNTLHIRVQHGQTSREFIFHRPNITVGRRSGCDLLLNWPGLRSQHLEIDNNGQGVRVKLISPNARATLANRPLSGDWQNVKPGTCLLIPHRDDQNPPLQLHLHYDLVRNGVVVFEPSQDSHRDDFGVQFVCADPMADSAPAAPAFSKKPKLSTDAGSPAPKAKKPLSLKMVSISLALVFGLLLFLALFWNTYSRFRIGSAIKENVAYVIGCMQTAEQQLRDKNYVGAEAPLDAAEAVAMQHSYLVDQLNEIRVKKERPAIKFGANGYIEIESRWLPEADARAWQAARSRDDPKILQLEQSAAEALATKDLDNAKIACDSVLAMMDAHPVKEHPWRSRIEHLALRVRNESIAAEMTAKGLVLYDNQWMSPEQRFRLEQQAKGLVEYRGEWMTESDAFAASQTDKGLIFYQNKWMTPEEKLRAQGYVQFEGNWVLPDEQERILSDRRAEQLRQQQAQLAEQQRLEQEAARRRQEADQIAQLKIDAYSMSQQFIKRKLKAPASARFQDYTSNDVIVAYDDGWFIVKATVDAQNSYGAILRSTHICKLRPTVGDVWETELTELLD